MQRTLSSVKEDKRDQDKNEQQSSSRNATVKHEKHTS